MCLFQSFFGLNFGSAADIDIILDNQDERKMAEIRDENGRKERHYLYFDGESVNGKVNLPIFNCAIANNNGRQVMTKTIKQLISTYF